nr:hypothetical protein [Escherichia coli]
FAGKKSAQIREILISESAWEEMTCLFAPSLVHSNLEKFIRCNINATCVAIKLPVRFQHGYRSAFFLLQHPHLHRFSYSV